METKELKYSEIFITNHVNLRELENDHVKDLQNAIEEYGENWQEHWKELPCVNEDNILFSGFHTLQAFRDSKYFKEDAIIKVEVQEGNPYFLATGTNHQHGRRRTNAEKRAAVLRWLEDEEARQWTAGHIAKMCRVTPQTVINIESSLSNLERDNYQRPTLRKYINKYGAISWVETATIGPTTTEQATLFDKTTGDVTIPDKPNEPEATVEVPEQTPTLPFVEEIVEDETVDDEPEDEPEPEPVEDEPVEASFEDDEHIPSEEEEEVYKPEEEEDEEDDWDKNPSRIEPTPDPNVGVIEINEENLPPKDSRPPPETDNSILDGIKITVNPRIKYKEKLKERSERYMQSLFDIEAPVLIKTLRDIMKLIDITKGQADHLPDEERYARYAVNKFFNTFCNTTKELAEELAEELKEGDNNE